MKIALLGDIALIGKYDVCNSMDWKGRLTNVRDQLLQYDYVIANLESPLTHKERTLICKSMHIKGAVHSIEILKFLGVKAVSLANNHIFDFGFEGLKETIKTLEENEIEWFGAFGKNISIQDEKMLINVSGFCCLTTGGVNLRKNKGVNILSLENIKRQLDKDKKENAYSIVSLHWGNENVSLPSKDQVMIARKIVELKNSTVIHGHHPHCIEGIETHDGGLTAYSLGNFLFDECSSINGRFRVKLNDKNIHSYILDIEIRENLIQKYSIIPIQDKLTEGIVFEDNMEYIDKISKRIREFSSSNYQELRMQEFIRDRDERIGMHDIKWFMSRLNYYSVGSKLLSVIKKIRYRRIYRKFCR